MSGTVLLGCGHAHLSALRHWRGTPGPVVVTRAAVEAYSGLVPSVLRRERPAAGMQLSRAVARAGGRMIVGECVAIDLAGSRLHLADGRAVPFALLSLDLGAAGAAPPGALPVRPAGALPAHVARIETGRRGPVAVVGAGAAGTELALSLAIRWAGQRDVVLICDGAPLPGTPGPVRRRAIRALRDAGVLLRHGRAEGCDREGVLMRDGTTQAVVAAFWAAGCVASPLPRAAGLACDEAGFVAVDASLRSLSHPFVFAAGDGAALGVAKSGAFAVAAGAALARSLACAEAGRPLPRWRPQAAALAVIGTGGGRGLAWRGPFWLAGRPAWWLKLGLDHRWLVRLR